MLYELINPSDPVTFEAPDLKVAALVTIILGQGQYGAQPVDDSAEGVPIMLFFGRCRMVDGTLARRTHGRGR